MKLFEKFKDYLKKQKKEAKNNFCVESNDTLVKEGHSLLDLLFLIKRYWIVFLVTFLVICIPSFIIGSSRSKTMFYSTGEISFNTLVHGDLYTIVQEDLQTDKTADSVAMILKDKSILHYDSSEITGYEIKEGVSSEHKSDSTNIFVKVRNTDNSVVVKITNELLDYIVHLYDDEHDQRHIKDYIFVGSYASNVYQDVNGFAFYVLLGTLGGLLLSFGLIVLIDKIRKIVICPKDIKLNCLFTKKIRSNKNVLNENDLVDFNKLIKDRCIKNTIHIIPIIVTIQKNDLNVKTFIDSMQKINKNLEFEKIEYVTKNSSSLASNYKNNAIRLFIFIEGNSSFGDLNYSTQYDIIENPSSSISVILK